MTHRFCLSIGVTVVQNKKNSCIILIDLLNEFNDDNWHKKHDDGDGDDFDCVKQTGKKIQMCRGVVRTLSNI